MSKLYRDIIESWSAEEGVNSNDELLAWINGLNETTHVIVRESSIKDDPFWFYDDKNGEVLNNKRGFFSIKGIRMFVDGEYIKEQPIINQPEIGYLGIICKKLDGVLHFLMQAKIEPGNVNCVQISPTIQATKSNFTRVHGGKLPSYFDYFDNADKHRIIYDQVQSEQGTRFYKKRNRNIIILIDEDIEVLPNYMWMTLGQLKHFLMIDNLVNMDTRTVLAGLPLLAEYSGDDSLEAQFRDKALYKSFFEIDPYKSLNRAMQKLNNYKMYRETRTEFVPLNQLVDWKVSDEGITCRKDADFSVGYYDIEIDGREVKHWTQPLFKANGIAEFGLLTTLGEDGVRRFLIKLDPEIGSFDSVEFGPTVRWEATRTMDGDNAIERIFRRYDEPEHRLVDVILSEEGGRFYHEQNRNVILDVPDADKLKIPEDYIWVEMSTLWHMVNDYDVLNIQLRNLLTLINL